VKHTKTCREFRSARGQRRGSGGRGGPCHRERERVKHTKTCREFRSARGQRRKRKAPPHAAELHTFRRRPRPPTPLGPRYAGALHSGKGPAAAEGGFIALLFRVDNGVCNGGGQADEDRKGVLGAQLSVLFPRGMRECVLSCSLLCEFVSFAGMAVPARPLGGG